jgi:hypothetical protein
MRHSSGFVTEVLNVGIPGAVRAKHHSYYLGTCTASLLAAPQQGSLALGGVEHAVVQIP